MPKDTFYRLPEEKRERLKTAIIQELKRVPVEEMSINRIIQAAEIPRGSYYQYFSGKDDVLGYVLHEYKSCMLALAKRIRNETKGDLYELFVLLFSYTMKYGLAEENYALFRNVLSGMRMGDLLAECNREMCAAEDVCMGGAERADRQRVEMLVSVFKDSVAKLFALPARAEEVKADFEEKVRLLQLIPEG